MSESDEVGILGRISVRVTVAVVVAVAAALLFVAFLTRPADRDVGVFLASLIGGAATVYAAFYAASTLRVQIRQNRQAKAFETQMNDAMGGQLLTMLRRELEASGVPGVAQVDLDPSDPHLMTWARRLAVTAEVRDVKEGQVHAHVVSWLPNASAPGGKDKLDACVMGFGATTDLAVRQVAEVWLRQVAAPVLSCLAAHTLLDADHFEGHEPWGIPGGHGFVGPFSSRGANQEIDERALAECSAFAFDGYPTDGRPHVAKVTLLGRNGTWERHLELDGHTQGHTDMGWTGLPGPTSTVICVRFAVFVRH